MRRRIDLSLYLVIGCEAVAPRHVLDVVREAVAGGVTAVQLREKHAATGAFVDAARALVQFLRPLGVPLIVNDRADVALAAGADGVHVGQDDMRVADVRRLVGPEAIVGVSVTSAAEALALDGDLASYAGIGPVFATATKRDAATPLGLAGTAAICRRLTVPCVAIGGITAANAHDVRGTGVQGVAVVSAICSASDPRDAAASLASVASARGPV